MGPALAYLQIRALAAPAVLVTYVLQGLCLAQHEAQVPLRVAILAGVVNLVLDIVCVLPQFLGWGAAGAALATTVSQYAAVILMWIFVQRKAAKTEIVIPATTAVAVGISSRGNGDGGAAVTRSDSGSGSSTSGRTEGASGGGGSGGGGGVWGFPVRIREIPGWGTLRSLASIASVRIVGWSN
jgi:uncharacterized membrane protein YgcG